MYIVKMLCVYKVICPPNLKKNSDRYLEINLFITDFND